jgi:hypothetical protein
MRQYAQCYILLTRVSTHLPTFLSLIRASLFAKRKVTKTYTAIVVGHMQEDE